MTHYNIFKSAERLRKARRHSHRSYISLPSPLGEGLGVRLLGLLFAVFMALPSFAQTVSDEPVQDAMYVYRNDGKFHGFYNAEVVRVEFSKIDTLGREHFDYVVQEIETLDSLYRIPISAIDSVSFITPRTEYAEGVKATTTSELWDYVVGSDSLTQITLSPSTPANLIPAVGDKLCTTKSRPYLPGGFYGTVRAVSTTAAGTLVECRNEGFRAYLTRHIFKGGARVNEDAAQAARRRALMRRVGHDSESGYLNVALDTIKKEWDWSGSQDLGSFQQFDWKVSGEAKAGVAIAPEIYATAFGSISPSTGINMDCALRVKANLAFDIHAKATIEGSYDQPFPGTKIWIPDTPFFINTGPGINASVSGELEVNYHYDKDVAVEVQAQLNESSVTDNLMLNAQTRDLGSHEKFEAQGTAVIAMGPYYKVALVLGVEDMGKIEARIDAGGKVSMQITVSSDNFYEHTDTIDTSLYDILNQDGCLKTGAYAKAKITASFLKHEKEWPVWEYEPAWTFDGGIVPKFGAPASQGYNEQSRRLTVSSGLSRSVFFFTAGPVGFELFDEKGKPLGKRVWTTDDYVTAESFGTSYRLTFDDVEPEKWYIVHPLCHFGKQEIVAGPGARIYAGLEDLFVEADSAKFDYQGGTSFVKVRNTYSKDTYASCQYDDYSNRDWFTVEETKDGYNIICQPNTTPKRRSGYVEFRAQKEEDTFGFNARRSTVYIRQEVDPAYIGLLFQRIAASSVAVLDGETDYMNIESPDGTYYFGAPIAIGEEDIVNAFEKNPVIHHQPDGTFALQGVEGLSLEGKFDPVEAGGRWQTGSGTFTLATDYEHHRKSKEDVEAAFHNGIAKQGGESMAENSNPVLDEHFKRNVEGTFTVTWDDSRQQYLFRFTGTGTLDYSATCYKYVSGVPEGGDLMSAQPNARITGTVDYSTSANTDVNYGVFYELNE